MNECKHGLEAGCTLCESTTHRYRPHLNGNAPSTEARAREQWNPWEDRYLLMHADDLSRAAEYLQRGFWATKQRYYKLIREGATDA